MISVIAPSEIEKAKRTQKIMIGVYAAIAALVVAANVLIAVLVQPIDGKLACALNIVLTSIFGIASLFFFSVKFRMVRAYVKFYHGVQKGLKETSRGVFAGWKDEIVTKDGLECYGFVSIEAVKKRPDMPEREVLIEHTVARPNFNIGDKLRYATYGNVLVAYEVFETAPVQKTEEQAN